jgi:hypothetical protein
MGDTKGDPNDQQSGARAELQALAEQLREQARRLGDPSAMAAADRVHEHAHHNAPNAEHMRSLLADLETKLALSPTVNALLQALSNVGL